MGASAPGWKGWAHLDVVTAKPTSCRLIRRVWRCRPTARGPAPTWPGRALGGGRDESQLSRSRGKSRGRYKHDERSPEATSPQSERGLPPGFTDARDGRMRPTTRRAGPGATGVKGCVGDAVSFQQARRSHQARPLPPILKRRASFRREAALEWRRTVACSSANRASGTSRVGSGLIADATASALRSLGRVREKLRRSAARRTSPQWPPAPAPTFHRSPRPTLGAAARGLAVDGHDVGFRLAQPLDPRREALLERLQGPRPGSRRTAHRGWARRVRKAAEGG